MTTFFCSCLSMAWPPTIKYTKKKTTIGVFCISNESEKNIFLFFVVEALYIFFCYCKKKNWLIKRHNANLLSWHTKFYDVVFLIKNETNFWKIRISRREEWLLKTEYWEDSFLYSFNKILEPKQSVLFRILDCRDIQTKKENLLKHIKNYFTFSYVNTKKCICILYVSMQHVTILLC
jgi:hypothetical protein